MGIEATWRAAITAITARRADRRSGLSRCEKCCVFIYKRTYAVCLTTLGLLLFLGVYLSYLLDASTLEPVVSASEESGAVTLLIWTHPFDRYSKLPDCSALFRIDGCTLTDNVREYPRADAVVIHHREVATGKAKLPPEPRPPAQKWIWMNYESPAHTPRLWRFNAVFNLTMSYRKDSDIFLPYGYLIPRAPSGKTPLNRYAHPLHKPSSSHLLRPRLVAWVISNWSESHARVAFYYQLCRHIQVDVFGRAGRPMPKEIGGLVQLVGSYQFYLALENSQSTDYITEKLWNALLAGAVPVVLGPSRKNYERFLPPEAFIHVDDFPTVGGLAGYLLTLRRNPARLRWHLDWRKGYSVYKPVFWAEHYCAACRAVRRSRGRADVVKDLRGWFHS